MSAQVYTGGCRCGAVRYELRGTVRDPCFCHCASCRRAAGAAPQVYQQAAALRKHIVWSDLRKGVILSMIGFAFVLYAIIANGEPSWVGLILLCVGIGYIVLWWMEGRHLNQASVAGPGKDAGGTGSSGG